MENRHMARRSEAEQLAALREQRAQLEEKEGELVARIKERERKQDTRRKIVLGGVVLARAVQGDGWAVTARTEAIALMSERDRALFETPGERSGDAEGGSDE